MKYSHIVFDVDGTLIDNEKVVLASLQKAIEQTDCRRFELEALRFALGIPGVDALIKLDVSDPLAVHLLWEQISTQHAGETRLFDGISETVAALSQKGHTLGIITSRTREELLSEDICCKGWMSNPLLKQRDSQLIRSRMKRFSGKGEISIGQAA